MRICFFKGFGFRYQFLLISIQDMFLIGTIYGCSSLPETSGGGYAPSFFASGSPPSSSPVLSPNYALFRRSMFCCVNMPGPIKIGRKRQITLSIYIPTRRNTERKLMGYGSRDAKDYATKIYSTTHRSLKSHSHKIDMVF